MEHNELIAGVEEQFQSILKNSGQSIYVYLDDINKFCNEKFSSLLGYSSPKEWADVKEPFPVAFVAEKSQQDLISAYQKAMQQNVGSQIEVIWKKKDGSLVPSKVILVPIEYENHLFALHFIDPK